MVDVLLVVGSKNSSNSNRLREVSENCGTKAYLVDNVGEINKLWLENVGKIGVTAGASAPEILVKEVVAWLDDIGAGSIHEMDGADELTSFELPK